MKKKLYQKIFVMMPFIALVLFGCNQSNSDSNVESDSPVEQSEASVPNDDESENTSRNSIEITDHMMFTSTSNEKTEYMERFDSDGQISWYYSSKGKVNSLKLGFTNDDGIERVYFHSDPEKVYHIQYNENGFGLLSGSKVQKFKQVDHFQYPVGDNKRQYFGKWNKDGFVLQISDGGNDQMNVKCVKGQWNIDYMNARYEFKNGRIEFYDKSFNRVNHFTLLPDGRLQQSINEESQFSKYQYYERI